MTKTSKHNAASPTGEAQDAIALLTADHKAVKEMFKQFKTLKQGEGSDGEKQALVTQVCNALKVHAQIEEEIFYPAVLAAIADDDLMDEAEVEHASAKDLITQLESMKPGDARYDAKVTVLGELVDHHVKEEEGEMFPKAKKAKLDLQDLGAQLAERQLTLKDEVEEGGPASTASPAKKPARGEAGRNASNGR